MHCESNDVNECQKCFWHSCVENVSSCSSEKGISLYPCHEDEYLILKEVLVPRYMKKMMKKVSADATKVFIDNTKLEQFMMGDRKVYVCWNTKKRLAKELKAKGYGNVDQSIAFNVCQCIGCDRKEYNTNKYYI